MTIEQAKQVLAAPMFGDQRCIEARDRLRDADKEAALRPKLIGKWLDCIMCSYRGDKDCPMCKGAGKHIISKQLADSWDLDVLESVAEELGL